MTVKRNSPQDATQHALRLVLASAEEDWPTYKAIYAEVDKRNARFASDVILAMTVIAANSVKTARPDGWNAFLRLNLLDIQADPEQWAPDTKETLEHEDIHLTPGALPAELRRRREPPHRSRNARLRRRHHARPSNLHRPQVPAHRPHRRTCLEALRSASGRPRYPHGRHRSVTPSDRATKLTMDLLRAAETYDAKAVGATIKRIIPNHTRRVIAALAVLALISIKQQHASDWPEHVTAKPDTYAQEAP